MRNINTINICVVLILCLLNTSCKNNEDDNPKPINTELKLKLKLIYGDNQNGEFNKELKDSIVFEVTDGNNMPVPEVKVKYVPINGSVLYNYGFTDSIGRTYCYWIGGCESSIHKMNVYLIDSDHNHKDSLVVSSNISRPVNFGLPCFPAGKYIKDIAVNSSEGTLYLVTGDDPYIYVSYDHGINWTALTEVPFATGYKGIEVQDDGDIFVCTTDGKIWRASSALKWEYLMAANEMYINLISVNNDILFYSVHGKTYRSVNNGDDWQLSEQGYFNDVAIHELYSHPDGTLYKMDGWNNILYSEDNGDTWNFLTYNEPFRMDISGNMYCRKSAFRERTIMRSVDKGVTWSDLVTLPNNEFANIEITNFCVQESNVFIYANDKRVYKYSIADGLLKHSEPAKDYLYPLHMTVTKNGTVLLWDQNKLTYNLTFSEI